MGTVPGCSTPGLPFAAAKPAQKVCTVVRPFDFGDTATAISCPCNPAFFFRFYHSARLPYRNVMHMSLCLPYRNVMHMSAVLLCRLRGIIRADLMRFATKSGIFQEIVILFLE